MEMSIDKLQTYAIAFVVIGIVLALGLKVMSGVKTGTYDNLAVDNETFNATSDPFETTISKASDANFVELTYLECYKSVSQSDELTGVNCNISDATAGKIKISASVDKDDLESANYKYDATNKATEGANSSISGLTTFAEWLPLIALVIVAVVIIFLVTMFRGTTRRRGA